MPADLTPSDDIWAFLNAANAAGAKAALMLADGREVTFQVAETHIQWSYVGDEEWNNLIALSELTGEPGADSTVPGPPGADSTVPGPPGSAGNDGREIEIQVGETHLQWRYVGDAEWTNIVAIDDLKGEPGADGTNGTNGTNGADGADGASAYEVAVANGFVGDEAAWLLSLKGEPGADGADGSGGAAIPTGSRLTGYWLTAPTGYILADGKQIGNATSGATGRANADTEALFALIWEMNKALSDVWSVSGLILDSDGAASSYGTDAATAFTDSKRLVLPDERQRVPVMWDPDGSVLAGIPPGLGLFGGEQTHTLTTGELPSHSHAGPAHTHGYNKSITDIEGTANVDSGGGGAVVTALNETSSSDTTSEAGGGATGNAGSGEAHNNMPPFIFVNVALKL